MKKKFSITGRTGIAPVLAALLLCAGTPAIAQDAEQRTQVHGFGAWFYGRSNAPNEYLGATPKGEFGNSRFALNTISTVSPKLTVAAQIELLADNEGLETELDFVFASWKFSDHAQLLAGKVKLPFGLSTEVFDVGTVRPFLDLPQAVYGPVGMIAEGYSGLGLRGTAGSRWVARYDLYLGGATFADLHIQKDVLQGFSDGHGSDEEGEEGEEGEEVEEIDLENVVGGRLVLETPVQGLSLGVSGYTGDIEDEDVRATTLGVQVEYNKEPWSLQAEFVRGDHETDDTRRSFYVQGARRLGAWEVAGRYERLKASFPDLSVSNRSSSLLRHRAASVGLNYWFSPEFVLKASYSRVDGNRLAGPPLDDLAELFELGRVNQKTNAFHFGAQFSF